MKYRRRVRNLLSAFMPVRCSVSYPRSGSFNSIKPHANSTKVSKVSRKPHILLLKRGVIWAACLEGDRSFSPRYSKEKALPDGVDFQFFSALNYWHFLLPAHKTSLILPWTLLVLDRSDLCIFSLLNIFIINEKSKNTSHPAFRLIGSANAF